MTPALVTKYGGPAAARAKVDQQLATVNAVYETQFARPIRWVVQEFYTYTQPAANERFVPHPNANFLLLYSENTLEDDGGYLPLTYSVVIRWLPTAPYNGVFGPYAADSLIHELGHARGGLDLYNMGVDAANNPINGQAFTAPGGFMSLIYSQTDFDFYTKNIVNAGRASLYNDDHIVKQSLPPVYRVKATRNGVNIAGATVALYPSSWGSRSVSSTPLLTGTTDANGVWQLPRDPFNPNLTYTALEYPLFLAKVTQGAYTGYAWLAFTDAGNAYFANPTAAYQLNVAIS